MHIIVLSEKFLHFFSLEFLYITVKRDANNVEKKCLLYTEIKLQFHVLDI